MPRQVHHLQLLDLIPGRGPIDRQHYPIWEISYPVVTHCPNGTRNGDHLDMPLSEPPSKRYQPLL